MGNKCKICGYRFKSRDEAICPECFTAREDDISCERYSANEHSHAKSYISGLHDTGESFVQREMREERRNSFARENFGARANAGLDLSDDGGRFNQQARFERDDYNYDFSKQYRQIMSQSYPDQPPASQQTAYQQQNQSKPQASGFTAAGQIFAMRNAMRTGSPKFTASRGQKKKNSAGAVLFLIVFIMIFVGIIVTVNEKNQEETQDIRSQTQTYTYMTKATTRQATTKALNSEDKANNKTFSAQVISQTFTDVGSSDIPENELSKLTAAASTNSKDDSPWKVATFTVRIKCAEGLTEESKKNLRIFSSYLYCYKDNGTTERTSTSTSVLNQQVKFEEGSSYADVTLRLLMDKSTTFGTLRFYLSGTRVLDRYTFNLQLG